MNRILISRTLESPSQENIQTLFDDDETVFWVDWREEDDAIVEYCESILKTGSLSAEVVDADNEAGFEMYITFKDKCAKVPLVVGPEDHHITLVALNEILAPDYEIRFCIDSNGSDTVAFLPLPTEAWRQLEAEYGDAVAARFYRLASKPNVFTDPLRF